MARTKPGQHRRGDLLDAAESLVMDHGTSSFTVDDVTSGAGVAKGTFYLHFTNKADLLEALCARYVERFVARQREAASEGSGVQRVERWLLAGIEEYRREVRLHDVLFQHVTHATGDEPNLAVTALRDLLVDTGVQLPDVEATAMILYQTMHGTADHVVHVPADRDRMRAELSRLCAALLGTDPTGTEPTGTDPTGAESTGAESTGAPEAG